MDLYNLIATPETRRMIDICIGLFLSCSTLIQISPIKINPWDRMLGWIGKSVNKELREEVSELRSEIDKIQEEGRQLSKSVDEIWISEHRRKTLTFARECRRGVVHSLEEWRFIIANMEEYENYCRRNRIDNGVIKEDSTYVRELYHRLLNEHQL